MSNITVKMKLSPTQTGKLYFENESNKEKVKQLEFELQILKHDLEEAKRGAR